MGRGGNDTSQGEHRKGNQNEQATREETELGDVDILDHNRKRPDRHDALAMANSGKGITAHSFLPSGGENSAVVPFGVSPVSPPPKRGPKKAETVTEDSTENKMAIVTGSLEGRRQAQ